MTKVTSPLEMAMRLVQQLTPAIDEEHRRVVLLVKDTGENGEKLSKSIVRPRFYSTTEELIEDLPSIMERNQEGFNAYLGMNPMKVPEKGKKPGRKKKDVLAAVGFAIDIDTKKGYDHDQFGERLAKAPVEPSMLVTTSRDQNMHGYYLFEEPVEDLVVVERLAKAVEDYFGVKDSTYGVERVFRLAGTINQKFEHRDEDPFIATISHVDSKPHRYSLDFLLEKFGSKAATAPVLSVEDSTYEAPVGSPADVEAVITAGMKTPAFLAAWRREGTGSSADNPSAADFRLAAVTLALGYDLDLDGWTQLLSRFRGDQGADTVKILSRPGYVMDTVEKARKAVLDGDSKKSVNVVDEPQLIRLGEALRRVEEDPLPEWVIEGLIPMKGLVVLGSRYKSGKSIVATHMALAVATGNLSLGNFATAQKGPVVFLAVEEDLRSVVKRFERIARGMGLDMADVPVFLPKLHWEWCTDISGLENLEKEMDRLRPSLVVVDTFREFFRGNENDANEVRPVLSALKRLATQYGAGVLFAHHVRKPNGKSEQELDPMDLLRGSGDIPAAVDSSLSVMMVENSKIYMKGKHRAAPWLDSVRLDVAFNDDGDKAIGLNYVGPEDPPGKEEKGKNGRKKQKGKKNGGQ